MEITCPESNSISYKSSRKLSSISLVTLVSFTRMRISQSEFGFESPLLLNQINMPQLVDHYHESFSQFYLRTPLLFAKKQIKNTLIIK